MEHKKETTYHGLKSVRLYGMMLVGTLIALHVIAFFVVSLIEKNEIHRELVQWSQTISKANPAQPISEFHLPEEIIALRVNKLERAGFYETHTDRGYLAYANPENNYILAKSEETVDREIANIAAVLVVLLVGEIVLIVGWWMFAKAKVRELFEVE